MQGQGMWEKRAKEGKRERERERERGGEEGGEEREMEKDNGSRPTLVNQGSHTAMNYDLQSKLISPVTH